MKHICDAEKLLEKGDGTGALAVLDNLLGLAPRNPEALRLKARILDSWGRFDDSMRILQTLAQQNSISNEVYDEIEERAQEEKEGFIFSELTAEGRVFYAHPAEIMWVSVFGFIGCATFLLTAPQWFAEVPVPLVKISWAFFTFVLLPWFVLMFFHFRGIKRIMIGLENIVVSSRFKEQKFSWSSLSAAVVEYDVNPNNDYLKLHLFSRDGNHKPLITFDISKKNAVVRARRHFMRCVLTYIDTVCYISKGSFTMSQVLQDAKEPLKDEGAA